MLLGGGDGSPTMKDKKKTIYYRFAEQILNALRIARVRCFPHKHDPKKYGVWTHTVLLALKQLADVSYRFVVDMLAEMPGVLVLLNISRAPHWSSVHKAAKRYRGTLIERLVAAFVRSTKSQRMRAGIDSTGFQPTCASVYYTKVISKDGKKRRAIKKHLKLSTVVDLDHQLPVCYKVRRGPASDQWDALPLVRKAHRIKPIKSFDGDKGYTGEKLRCFVVEECNAEDRIKIKNPEVPIWRTSGEFLKKAKRKKLRRNYRSLNETYHSVIKRVTGSQVRAVTVKMQNTEIAFKILACSALRRARSSPFNELFY